MITCPRRTIVLQDVRTRFFRSPKAPYRKTRTSRRGGPAWQLPPGRQIINLPTAPTCLGPAPVAMRSTQQPRDTIISSVVVTQSRGFPRRFKTADGSSLTQGRMCVPNVSSDMPTHKCHGHHRIAACCTSHSVLATTGLLLAFPANLALRHCTIFVATSGCRNTKLPTSQITVHLPHLRSRYSAVGTVPTLWDA